MIDLPEEIIELILSYAPDFRDILKNVTPNYYKIGLAFIKKFILDIPLALLMTLCL